MKSYTLREPDGTVIGKLQVADDLTPEEVQEAAERRVAELKVEAARKAVKEVLGRPAPPPHPALRGGKDPLDDEIRCPWCRVGEPAVKRRDLLAHLKAHDDSLDRGV